MQISRIETRVVRVPRKQAYGRITRTALGSHEISEHAVVLIETADGLTGIGEVASCFARRGHLLAREIETILVPHLLGRDPRDIRDLVNRMDAVLFGSEPAKAGVEMALWDILGKSLGVPVYRLLGGKVRESTPLSYSVPFGSPEEMAEFAVARAEEGFRTVKVKVGQDPITDVRAVAAVRQAVGPDGRVRVDANMAWRTPKQAVAVIEAMRASSPELVEQPLPPRELEGLAEIRRRTDVPIMADESVWSRSDAAEVLRRTAVDVINVYVAEAGGLLRASEIFAMAETFGVPCMIGSMPELGIATAAQIHLATAMSNLAYDSDVCGCLYHETDIIAEPLPIAHGQARPPEGAGLGVEIDMDAIEHLAA